MAGKGRRALRPRARAAPSAAGSPYSASCWGCLAPSSWLFLLGGLVLLGLLALGPYASRRGPALLRVPPSPAHAPAPAPAPAAPPPPPSFLRSAASALYDAAAAAAAAASAATAPPRRRVREYCPWSALPWHAPHELVRWSAPANFTALSYTAPPLDGAFALHIEGCDLSWVTQAAARQCLASLGHVVAVGDSVSRLLFMSLVHFLHTGSWSPVAGDGLPPSDAPRAWTAPPAAPGADASPLDIPRYLAATSARLHGAEVCDCYIGMHHTENRYYREAGVDASYVSFFSHAHGLRLHSPAFLNATCGAPPCAQAGCAVGACDDASSPRAQALSLQEGADDLRLLVELLRPDVLLFNAGHHRSLDTPEGTAEVVALARAMAAGEGARAGERAAWAAEAAAAAAAGLPAPPARRYGLEAAWEAVVQRLGGGGGEVSGAASGAVSGAASGSGAGAAEDAAPQPPGASARNFIWRTTTPRKDPDGVWAGVLADALMAYEGAPALGPAPAAPRAPWPRYESSVTAAVARAGGRSFDAFTLLWPLVMLARKEGRAETIAAVFAHPSDSLHHAPGVNSQLNRALLSFLCEDFEGEV